MSILRFLRDRLTIQSPSRQAMDHVERQRKILRDGGLTEPEIQTELRRQYEKWLRDNELKMLPNHHRSEMLKDQPPM